MYANVNNCVQCGQLYTLLTMFTMYASAHSVNNAGSGNIVSMLTIVYTAGNVRNRVHVITRIALGIFPVVFPVLHRSRLTGSGTALV